MEFKIQRAWQILEMEEPDASAVITQHHLMVSALINSKVGSKFLQCLCSILRLLLITHYVTNENSKERSEFLPKIDFNIRYI